MTISRPSPSQSDLPPLLVRAWVSARFNASQSIPEFIRDVQAGKGSLTIKTGERNSPTQVKVFLCSARKSKTTEVNSVPPPYPGAVNLFDPLPQHRLPPPPPSSSYHGIPRQGTGEPSVTLPYQFLLPA